MSTSKPKPEQRDLFVVFTVNALDDPDFMSMSDAAQSSFLLGLLVSRRRRKGGILDLRDWSFLIRKSVPETRELADELVAAGMLHPIDDETWKIHAWEKYQADLDGEEEGRRHAYRGHHPKHVLDGTYREPCPYCNGAEWDGKDPLPEPAAPAADPEQETAPEPEPEEDTSDEVTIESLKKQVWDHCDRIVVDGSDKETLKGYKKVLKQIDQAVERYGAQGTEPVKGVGKGGTLRQLVAIHAAQTLMPGREITDSRVRGIWASHGFAALETMPDAAKAADRDAASYLTKILAGDR